MTENISTITQQKNGQKITTIPKAIAGAVNFKNKDKIEWLFDKGDLIVRKK
jgi:antitoxin component of MazEF toxin-antitoxin module